MNDQRIRHPDGQLDAPPRLAVPGVLGGPQQGRPDGRRHPLGQLQPHLFGLLPLGLLADVVQGLHQHPQRRAVHHRQLLHDPRQHLLQRLRRARLGPRQPAVGAECEDGLGQGPEEGPERLGHQRAVTRAVLHQAGAVRQPELAHQRIDFGQVDVGGEELLSLRRRPWARGQEERGAAEHQPGARRRRALGGRDAAEEGGRRLGAQPR
mmetsp:Transcript_33135/g.92845  ORF Transcript_33135/g.92845 Transcript_33135/m.92845 type:complete len:208 (+) Transcript_33135:2263-2886(+)